MQDFEMLIGGEERAAVGGEWIETINPYTGKVWARVPRGRADDVASAVEAAEAALENPAWKNLTTSQRGALLRKVGDLILANAERLCDLEVQDNGKLRAEMFGQSCGGPPRAGRLPGFFPLNETINAVLHQAGFLI